jgi:pimeloyl-ACP methyl ester carboxylesterase
MERNSDAYRDAWVDAAEEANVLVAALGYPEADYDFAAYQMGGVIKNLQLRNMPPAVNGVAPSVWHLRDDDISFEHNDRREEWLFPDFDRIFQLLVAAMGSAQTRYDLFGHSAGGQILHRLALFHPVSQARRVVAANAGLYTLPLLDEPPIIGLQGTDVTEDSLAASLGAQLVVLLGEADNDGEAGGIHTPRFDRQGVDRLSRGRYFFETGKERARAMQVPFGWTLELVAGVGHDHRGMTDAAARLLYQVR